MSASSQREWRVQVYLYDLSGGLARSLSSGFLGKQIDGIWHSSIVVYGVEYFYGGGICYSLPGQSMAGRPVSTYEMGYTRVTQAEFHSHLRVLSPRFTPASYSLLRWNCNNFSDEACLFLTGKPIPSHITGLPAEVLSSPLGALLEPLLTQMENSMKSGGAGGASLVPGWNDQNSPNNSSDAANSLVLPPVNPALEPDRIVHTESVQFSSLSSSSFPFVFSLSFLLSSDRKLTSFLTLLKLNNKKVAESSQLNCQQIKALEEFAQQGEQFPGSLDSLLEFLTFTALNWSAALLFPVFGFLRVLLLHKSPTVAFHSNRQPLLSRILSLLSSASNSCPPATAALALCALSNVYSNPSVSSSFAADSQIHQLIRIGMSKDNQPIRSMTAALALNSSLALQINEGVNQISDDSLLELCSSLVECLSLDLDAETAERILSAIGCLAVKGDSAAVFLQSLSIQENLQLIQNKFASHSAITIICQEINKRVEQL
jgi:hypothetical protein